MSKIIGFIALALVVCGCGSTKVYDVTLEQSVVVNPAQGQAVKIVRVDDARVFAASSKDQLPTLANAGNINNPAIAGRVVGNYHDDDSILYEAMLPEGQTTAGLFRDVVTDAMRRAGYRVLAEGDGGYGDAAPVTVTVKKFWASMSPNEWNSSVSIVAEADVTAPLKGLANGVTANASIQKHTRKWLSAIDEMIASGIEAF